MSPFQLEVSLLISMGVGLTLYLLLGGADFGGGVWDLLARGSMRERQRVLISQAIGPVWEANHVWLIFVVTVLFAAFPPAFAILGYALYLPFTLAVAGIVFRGAAFAFRAHGDRGSPWQRHWTRVFGIASLITPLVLGAAAGAIASGRIRVDEAGEVTAGIWSVWTGPLSIAAGLLALGSCAFLAATYLTVEAVHREDRGLEDAFRTRALLAGAVTGVVALAGLFVLRAEAREVWHGMLARGWPLVVVSAVGGLVAMAAVWWRRYGLARIAAAAAVAGVLGAWGLAQWPHLIPPDVSVADVAAPPAAMRPILVGILVGVALLGPSLLLLLRLFKAAPAQSDD